jgi:hypothetical protein
MRKATAALTYNAQGDRWWTCRHSTRARSARLVCIVVAIATCLLLPVWTLWPTTTTVTTGRSNLLHQAPRAIQHDEVARQDGPLRLDHIHPSGWLDSFPPDAPADARCNTTFHSQTQKNYHRTTTPLHRALRIGPPDVPVEQILGRRNHQVILLEERFLVYISGRHVSNVQIQDLRTNAISTFFEGNPLASFNHMASIVFRTPEDRALPAAGYEVWSMCGAIGHITNFEKPIERVVVLALNDTSSPRAFLDERSWRLEEGPILPKPKGSCMEMTLDLRLRVNLAGELEVVHADAVTPLEDSRLETVPCSAGGSHGQHDDGVLSRSVECYSRLRKGWVSLPDLPWPIDHGYGHAYREPMPTEGSSVRRQCVVLAAGREINFGGTHNEVLRLCLDQHGRLLRSSWETYARLHIPRSAFAGNVLDDRYLLIAGGVCHRCIKSLPVITDSIEVVDLWHDTQGPLETIQKFVRSPLYWLTPHPPPPAFRSTLLRTRLYQPRFADASALSAHLWFICGGTVPTFEMENLADCEVMRIEDIMAEYKLLRAPERSNATAEAVAEG